TRQQREALDPDVRRIAQVVAPLRARIPCLRKRQHEPPAVGYIALPRHLVDHARNRAARLRRSHRLRPPRRQSQDRAVLDLQQMPTDQLLNVAVLRLGYLLVVSIYIDAEEVAQQVDQLKFAALTLVPRIGAHHTLQVSWPAVA